MMRSFDDLVRVFVIPRNFVYLTRAFYRALQKNSSKS